MITYLNTIFSSLRGGAASIINSALSWTFSSKGFSTDELSSLDRNTATIEDSRLVESACADFNGSSSYINYGDVNDLGSGNFSIYFLGNIKSVNTGIISKELGAGNNRYYVYADASGKLSVFLKDSASTTVGGAFPTSIDIRNNWHIMGIEIDRTSNTVEGYIDGVSVGTIDISTLVGLESSYDFVIGARAEGTAVFSDEEISWLGSVGRLLTSSERNNIQNEASIFDFFTVLQRSTYDISGNDNHGTPSNVTWGTQDSYHYNIIYGFDKYTDDATGLIEVLVPYVDGSPVVSSIASYTKQSSHPADYWNNGCETKRILGATTFDGTGWGVDALVKTADTEEILHNNATGYGKALGYDDDKAEQGEYLFMNVATENQHKDLLLYSTPQTGTTAIAIHKFIGNGNNLVTSVSGDYVFSKNNYAVWS